MFGNFSIAISSTSVLRFCTDNCRYRISPWFTAKASWKYVLFLLIFF